MSNRWQMVAGYTYAQSRVKGLSVNIDPNTLINVTGPLAGQNTNFNGQIGDRPHQFKATGTYILPFYDIGLAANLNSQKTQRWGTRELQASVDFNNLTNANTFWDARTLGGTINLRQNGDPVGAANTLPQFGSPSQVYGPRNIRFNVAFRF